MTLEEPAHRGRCAAQDIPERELKELQEVRIDTGLPGPARMRRYLEQIRNPYSFLCDGIPVHITFTEDGPKLSEALARYIQNLR